MFHKLSNQNHKASVIIKSMVTILFLLVFSSVPAQTINLDDLNSNLNIRSDFGATKVKDSLNNLGMTVNKNYSDYDKSDHIKFLSSTTYLPNHMSGKINLQTDMTLFKNNNQFDTKKGGLTKGHLKALAVAGAAAGTANYINHGHPIWYNKEYIAVQRSVRQRQNFQNNNTSLLNNPFFMK